MKRLAQIIATAGVVVVLLVVSGCDLTEMNENPNEATQATPVELLTNAQLDFASLYWRDYAGAYWMRYAQHLTTNQYTTADRYGFPSSRQAANNFNFNEAYLVLNDLEEIKRLNRRTPEDTRGFGPPANQIAVAKIMQAYVFQYLTDQYGPVPFTEALQAQGEGNFAPAYSGQEEIYNSLLTMLTEASDSIKTGSAALASGDLVYGGEMAKWKKFANALKMRVAMRMSDQAPSTAETAINEAISAGTFSSNDDNAVVPFSSSPPHQNPIYGNYSDGRDDWAAPQALTSIMNDTQDPRRPAFFEDANADKAGHQANGFPYGLPQEEAQALFTNPDQHFSRPSQQVRAPDFPCILMQYDEVAFIKAEAAIRSDLNVSFSESNDQLYQTAITASVNRWGVTNETVINNFLGRLEMPSSGSFSVAQDLGVQKWVAQYLQGMQAWSTYRRLDFQGVLQVPPGNPGASAFGKQIAVRMTYPPDEETLNGSNVGAAVSNLLGGSGAGTDDQGVLLWWDTEYKPPQP